MNQKNIQSIGLAKLYIKIAEVKFELQLYDEAEKYYKKSISIFLNNGYSKNTEYFNSIYSYANYNYSIKNYVKADSLLKDLLLIYERTGNRIEYAETLFSYGIKLELRNEKEADSCFQKSIKLLVEYYGEHNPKLILNYSALASFYAYTYKDHGVFYLTKELESLRIDLIHQFEFLSSEEKAAYVNLLTKNMFYNISSINRDISLRSIFTPFIYNKVLLFKNTILNNSSLFQAKIIQSKSPQIKKMWQDYLAAKSALLQKYKNRNSYDQLKKVEENVENLEKILIRNISGIDSFKIRVNIGWKGIQSKLKSNESAIEFIASPYRSNIWSDSTLYVALIIRPGFTHPKYVYLFEEKQLSSVLKKEGALDQTYINKLYQQKDSSNPLYQLIWQPLDSLLEGVKTIYVAPSGLLHKIALGAIPTADGKTVSDKYGLQILGTTADIINKKEDFIDKKSIQEAIVFGGINYDKASTKPIDFASTATENVYAYVPTDSTRGATGKWNYLSGSLKEAEDVAGQFKQQKITTRFYSDSTATETLFKNMPINSSSVIHIATHGYFFPDIIKKPDDGMRLMGEEKQSAFRVSDNPLLRSGLIFAGANPVWTNPDYESTATDDGILTAYEISNMDLSNVKLVVLSACETGLGDIKGSEGVFGLQRAFKLAGVKNIIMSLWKVPDDKTMELMQLFYQNCFTGKSISEALKKAQGEMRNKYPASPYYWAGFSLLQ